MKQEMKNLDPYWPAALRLDQAAAYCGLSPATFLKVCPLRPIAFTGSSRGNRYLRQRLDEWLLSLDPNEAAPKPRRFGSSFSEKVSRRSL